MDDKKNSLVKYSENGLLKAGNIIKITNKLIPQERELVPFLKKNGKYIYVEENTFVPVIENEFDEAYFFVNSYAIVLINKRYCIINKKGNLVFTKFFFDITNLENIFLYVSFNRENSCEVVSNGNTQLAIYSDFIACIIFCKGNYFLVDKYENILSPAYNEMHSYSNIQSIKVALNNKYGLLDLKGEIIIPLVYDDLYVEKENFIYVKKNNLFGVIDINGNILIPLIYERIYPSFEISIIRAIHIEKWGMIDFSGNQITPFKYDNIYYHNNNLLGVRINDKHGYIDLDGNEVIPVIYSQIEESCYTTDRKDNKVFFARISNINRLQNSASTIENEIFLGVINEKGKVLIPFEYTDFEYNRINNIRKSYSLFKKDSLGVCISITHIIVNDKGVILSDGFIEEYEGLFMVKRNGLYGISNSYGNEVIPIIYDDISGLYEYKIFISLTSFEERTKNKFLIGFRFKKNTIDSDKDFSENSKFGFYSLNCELILPNIYDEEFHFVNGYAKVKLNNLFGYINLNGVAITDIAFEEADSFSDDLAAVCKNGKYGYINTRGEVAIDFLYDYAWSFLNGHAVVKLNQKCGLVDINGRIIIPIKYQYIFNNSKGLYWTKLDEKFGVINIYSEVIINFIFDELLYNYNSVEYPFLDIKFEGTYIASDLTFARSGKDFYIINAKNKKITHINDKHISSTYLYCRCRDSSLSFLNTELTQFYCNNKSVLIDSNYDLVTNMYNFVYYHNLSNDLIKATYSVSDKPLKYLLFKGCSLNTPLAFNEIIDFSKLYIIARKDQCYYFIDRKGYILKKYEFSNYKIIDNYLYILKLNNSDLMCVVDLNMNEIIPPEYTHIEFLKNSCFYAYYKKRSKYVFYSKDGLKYSEN